MARILLVDDDPDQLQTRRLILEAEGHTVHSAGNQPQALAAFRQVRPDAMVMDLRLPLVEDGRTLIREVRRLSASVPIIVLSGLAADLAPWPEARMATRVLQKPFRPEDLLRLLSGIAAARP